MPIQWLTNPDRRGHLFNPEARLLLYVLFRSYWGQRGVALTKTFLTEIGLSRHAGYRALAHLERKRWVRVERSPGHALVIWPVILAA